MRDRGSQEGELLLMGKEVISDEQGDGIASSHLLITNLTICRSPPSRSNPLEGSH
jgi:hypothetical protein